MEAKDWVSSVNGTPLIRDRLNAVVIFSPEITRLFCSTPYNISLVFLFSSTECRYRIGSFTLSFSNYILQFLLLEPSSFLNLVLSRSVARSSLHPCRTIRYYCVVFTSLIVSCVVDQVFNFVCFSISSYEIAL